MGLKRVCAWCATVLEEGDKGSETTHGICPECAAHFFDGDAASLKDFIDRLAPPIFLVDGDARILTANISAMKALGKELESIRGFKGGDVIECAYARRPGGCGGTEHCQGCTIRNAVTQTFADEAPRDNLEAFQDVITPLGTVRTRFLISTKKACGSVLLRVDEISAVL